MYTRKLQDQRTGRYRAMGMRIGSRRRADGGSTESAVVNIRRNRMSAPLRSIAAVGFSGPRPISTHVVYHIYLACKASINPL